MITVIDIKYIADIVLIGHSICHKGWKLPYRAEREYEMIFPYQGELHYESSGIVYTLSTGDFLLIPPNTYHNLYTEKDKTCRFYYVHFLPGGNIETIEKESIGNYLMNNLKTKEYNENDCFFSLSQPEFHKVFLPETAHLDKQHRDEIFSLFEKALVERNLMTLHRKSMISLYMCQAMLCITRSILNNINISSCIPTNGNSPRLLQEIIYYIQENYMNHINIKSISNNFNISQQYLIRIFKQNTGIPPLKYINEYRISKAKHLMRYSNMTIKEICYAIGMETPHYFSRLFKKFEGVTPSEYIRGFNSKSNE